MKTKIFFAACLLFCMAMFQLQAQNGKNDNGSASYYVVWPVLIDLWVEGEFVDLIEGNMTVHLVDHYVNGVCLTERLHIHGVLTSEITGKTYRVSSLGQPVSGAELTFWPGDNPYTDEIEDGVWYMDPMGHFRDHLVCSDGRVYIMSNTWSLIDFLNDPLTGISDYEFKVAGKK